MTTRTPSINAVALRKLLHWIRERERARIGHDREAPKPWTSDVLLQRYRWCNVKRMDDRVSRWLLTYWYDLAQSPRTLVLAACLARLINWPDALEELGLPFKRWNANAVRTKLKRRAARGDKVFTGAYIINGAAGGSKIDQVVRHVQHMATIMEHTDARELLDPLSMRATWLRIKGNPGLGSFMAGQIVADLRVVLPYQWVDVSWWAPMGPGSKRGINRLYGLDKNAPLSQATFEERLLEVIEAVQKGVPAIYEDRALTAMDIQNCLCEFDKYRRLELDEGKVRSRYNGIA